MQAQSPEIDSRPKSEFKANLRKRTNWWLPIIPFLAGSFFICNGIWSAWRSHQAACWPTAPSQMINVTLKDKSLRRKDITHEVQVEYRYSVAGVAYTGSRLAYGYVGDSNFQAHQAIYEKLKAAKSVDVRYDPAAPGTSVLSYGIHKWTKLGLTIGAMWMALSLVLAIGPTRTREPKFKLAVIPFSIFVLGLVLILWFGFQSDAVLLQNLSVH